jgi:enoyl-CoA hydratase
MSDQREAPSFSTILYTTADQVATITLNRPDELNTIVPPMPDELDAAIGRAIRVAPFPGQRSEKDH